MQKKYEIMGSNGRVKTRITDVYRLTANPVHNQITE